MSFYHQVLMESKKVHVEARKIKTMHSLIPETETKSLQRNSKLGSCVNIPFHWVFVQRKGGQLAWCTPRAVEALTPTCSISLWKETITVWPQIHHHVPSDVKKKMLLRFSSSWWPSVPMCYKENSDHSLRILSKGYCTVGRVTLSKDCQMMTQA